MERSETIDSARTVCNLMVVLIHSAIVMAYARAIRLEGVVWEVITGPIAYAAMPTLFFISGFLLAKGWSYQSLGGKMCRRLRRLVVPYLLWNLAFVLVYLATASFLPSSQAHVETWRLTEVQGVLRKIIHPVIEPCDAPLWYIRSLVYLLMASPVVFPMLKRMPWIVWSVILLGLGYGMSDSPMHYRLSHLAPWYGVATFTLGAHVSLLGRDIRMMTENRFLLTCGCIALAIEVGLQVLHIEEPIAVACLCRFLEVVPVLKFSEMFSRRFGKTKAWKACVDASFFVYASHFLACSLVYHSFRQIARLPILQTSSVGVIVYFVGGLCLIIGFRMVIKRLCPKVIDVLEGRL